MTGEFLKFLATGGVAALVNLASRYGLNRMMSFEAAVVIAYLIGMTTAYILARLFVFQVSGRSIASEFRRFTLVNVVALAMVWLISVGLARLLFPAVGFTGRRRHRPSGGRAGAGRHQLFRSPPLHLWPACGMRISAVAPSVALASYVLLHWSGMALDPDSWAAWQGAVSIVAGKGYTYFSGNAIHSWPPLYAFYLAAWIGVLGPAAWTLMISNVVLVVLQAVLWMHFARTITRKLRDRDLKRRRHHAFRLCRPVRRRQRAERLRP